MNEQPRITIIDEAWRAARPVGEIAAEIVAGLRPPRFPLLRVDDIKAERKSRYVVKNVIPAEGLVVVWGRPKCGKSFWTFDLAAHVACGKRYRGNKVRKGVVVYIAAEGASGFRARVEAWCDRHAADAGQEGGDAQAESGGEPGGEPGGESGDAPQGPMLFRMLGMRLDLVSDVEAFIADVLRQCDGMVPVLVVIDTLNRTYSGSESSDEDMTRYIAAADAIKAAFGCAVIIVHHCGWETSRPRGHSSLTAAADTQIAIRRDGDFVTATVEWNKDGPEGYVNVSRLDLVEIGLDEDGDPLTTRIVVPCEAREAEHGEAARLKLTPNLQNALQALKMAISENGEATVSPHVPMGVLTVPTELWRQYFYRRSLETGEQKQETRKKAFQRASRDLQHRGVVGCWVDQVWLIDP